MPAITLPDGSQREFDRAVTVMDVAADIGPGLAKATLAGEVDGRRTLPAEVDLGFVRGDHRPNDVRDAAAGEVVRFELVHAQV